MPKKKLLIVGSFPFTRKDFKENIFFGGILSSCKSIINSSAFKKYELILIDSTQISNPIPSFFHRLIKAIKRIFLLVYKLISRRPDAALIFASDGASALEKGLMIVLCRIFQTKAIIFPRAGKLIQQTDTNIIFRLIIKFMFKQASLFLCQGPKWKDYALKNLQVEPSRVSIINNWTASESLLKIGSDRQFNITDSPRILFVGWLEDFKGVFELLSATKKILDNKPNLIMTYVGDGSAMKKIKQTVDDNKLQDSIKCLGWKSGQELNDCYRDNNIFVLPSWSEGLPNSVIEAMSAGLTVITTKVGTIPEVFTHNENLILIDPKCEEQIFNSIKNIIDDNNLRIRLAKNGHIFAKQHFSSEKVLSNLSQTIEEIITKK